MQRDIARLAGLFLVSVAILPALAATKFVVGQKDRQFSEESLAVPSGSAVSFVNNDRVAHNITVRNPGGVVSPGTIQKPGEKIDITFNESGSHEVRCGIHPKMKLTIKVD
jgi:plastocyanin